MLESASDHLFVVVVSLVLLVMWMCRADERLTLRASVKACRRPHRIFGNAHREESTGLMVLVDPDGQVTRKRRMRS